MGNGRSALRLNIASYKPGAPVLVQNLTLGQLGWQLQVRISFHSDSWIPHFVVLKLRYDHQMTQLLVCHPHLTCAAVHPSHGCRLSPE